MNAWHNHCIVGKCLNGTYLKILLNLNMSHDWNQGLTPPKPPCKHLVVAEDSMPHCDVLIIQTAVMVTPDIGAIIGLIAILFDRGNGRFPFNFDLFIFASRIIILAVMCILCAR